MDKKPHCCETLADTVRREGDLRYRRGRYTLERQGVGINYCPFCAAMLPEYVKFLEMEKQEHEAGRPSNWNELQEAIQSAGRLLEGYGQ